MLGAEPLPPLSSVPSLPVSNVVQAPLVSKSVQVKLPLIGVMVVGPVPPLPSEPPLPVVPPLPLPLPLPPPCRWSSHRLDAGATDREGQAEGEDQRENQGQ